MEFPTEATMTSPVRDHSSLSQIHRPLHLAGVSLASALLLNLVFSGLLPASVVPGSKPSEWPANPEKHKVTIHLAAANEKEAAMIAAANRDPEIFERADELDTARVSLRRNLFQRVAETDDVVDVRDHEHAGLVTNLIHVDPRHVGGAEPGGIE